MPLTGKAYTRMRNVDLGPNSHMDVSRLSAALRRRLISEVELVAEIVAEHGSDAAEKFISEVFWRTYWKGWLEQRPSVWLSYRKAVERAKRRLGISLAEHLRDWDRRAWPHCRKGFFHLREKIPNLLNLGGRRV